MKYILLCFTVFATGLVDSSVLPVEKCNLEDGECMKTQFQNAVPVFMSGIPELGIPVMDVMAMDDFKFDLSGLQFSLAGGKLTGLKTSIIDKVMWDLKKKTFEIDYHLDSEVTGHYTAAGRVLILPITGDGDFDLKLKNIHLKFYVDYEMEKKEDGKEYVVPKKLRFDFEVKDKASFYMTNLFNGNKDLSNAMLKFLNENWREISKEFGRPVIEVAAKIIFKSLRTFFKTQSITDIAVF